MQKRRVDFSRSSHGVGRILTLCLLLVLVGLTAANAFAAGQPQVVISVGAIASTDTQLLADVTVAFADTSFCRDGLSLSYHVVDEKGGMLAFENQRLPIVSDEYGSSWRTVYIDKTSLPPMEGTGYIEIQFDVVDEENSIWLAQQPDITLQSDSLTYDGAELQAVRQQPAAPAAGEVPETAAPEAQNAYSWVFSAVVNLALWCGIAYAAYKLWKKNKKTKNTVAGGV